MKYYNLLFAFFISIILHGFTFSQSLNHEWDESVGGNLNDILRGMAVDLNDDVITVGNFLDTADLDPGPGVMQFVSNGFYDSYVQKVDPNGNLIWAKSFGGNLDFVVKSVVTDAVGNIIMTGNYSGTGDFNPGAGVDNHTSMGLNDIFVIKLDSGGNYLWGYNLGSSTNDKGSEVDVDDTDNIYITGYFEGTVDFNAGGGVNNFTSNGAADIFVLKLDAAGNYIWNQTFGGITDDVGQCIHLDNMNNCIVGGFFTDTIDADPGAGITTLQSAGLNDIFIEKLDANGVFLWAISEGGPDDDIVRSIATDLLGDLYITGGFRDTVDFDPGAGADIFMSNGDNDVYIQKLDASGIHVWAMAMGDTLTDEGRSIIVDNSSIVYVTGNFSGSIDLDASGALAVHNTGGLEDIFIGKYQSNGDYIWSASVGDTLTQRGYVIRNDNNMNIYVAGIFNGLVDFDPGPGVSQNQSLNGSFDNYLMKFSQCNLDPSAALLNDTSVQANQAGALYQWLDCENSYAVIPGEMNQIYYPVSNGIYAVEVTLNGCVDTSACIPVTMIGILENDLGTSLSFYPNPTKNNVNILFGSAQEFLLIRVIDISGREVMSQEYLNASQIELTIDGEKGYYLIELQTTANKSAQIRILKY